MSDDWKAFLIENKWAPRRLIKEKFPSFNNYDLDNWMKKDRVKQVLNREYWSPSLDMSKDQAIDVLGAIFRYSIDCEQNFSLDDPEAAASLLQLKASSGVMQTYLYSNYLDQLPYDYKAWRQKGYTAIAFMCFHVYPGKSYCEKAGILPCMFLQTSSAERENQELLAMLETIYLRHLKKLSNESTQQSIDSAKEEFYCRCEDKGFINKKELYKYGWTLAATKRYGSTNKWLQVLADKFAVDLGYQSDEIQSIQWNTKRYRNENPERELTRCFLTNSIPTGLHHLLPRKDYPELTYHPENVVAISPAIHAFITRKSWSKETETVYMKAITDWIKANEGEKITCFNNAFSLIQKEMML